jgi:hypothetical protein
VSDDIPRARDLIPDTVNDWDADPDEVELEQDAPRAAADVLELRRSYWRNGYRPVAIYTGQKRPRGERWRADALQTPPLWVDRQPEDVALSTGLVTGTLAAADVDILIQAVTDRVVWEIEQIVGTTPLVRIGRAPKTLLAFRCDAPFTKLSTGTFVMPDGSEAQIEILADGQQFVADGIHPDTGRPYVWPAGSPETVPLSDVPAITHEQAQAIIARARDLMRANGGVEKQASARQKQPQTTEGGADNFFAAVNAAALSNLAAWVKHVFPKAVYQRGTRSWRVASKDRGRPDLQEDISLHAGGIQDFGLEHGLTAIDVVIEHGGASDAVAAAHWLSDRLGIEPATLGWHRSRAGEDDTAASQKPRGKDEDQPTPKLGRILTGDNFISRHVPPVWLIDGVVQRSRLYACTSITGHGKTAVWLYNACMIQAGRMIGQLETFRGNVLYLAGENPADLEARMIGMARSYDIPLDRLPFVLPGSFPLNDQEVDALKKEVAGLGLPLALIVGDTASSFFPGQDENDNVQAGGYGRTLRTFTLDCPGNPAVVALCHPIKGADRRSMLLPRGGGAFLNELDGNLANWSAIQGEVTEMHWCGKIRGPDFAPLGYRLRSVPTGLADEKSRPEMTIIAEPMSEEAVADHAKQTRSNEDVVLKALRDHPDWSYAQIAREAGWVDFEVDKPERWRVQRAVTALAIDKLIEQTRKGDPWTLTEKGEKALKKNIP